MNIDTYQSYVEDMVKGAISKGGGSAKGALQWLQKHQTAWKTILFTPNPTEKSTAFRDIERYLNSLTINDKSSMSKGSLNPDDVIEAIVKGKLENIFFVANAMIRNSKEFGLNVKKDKKDAKEAIHRLEAMGYEEVSHLKQLLEEALNTK